MALLYWPKNQEELQDVYLQSIQTELIRQADQRNIKLKLYKKSDGLESIEKVINAFFVIGWNNISEINFLKSLSANGIFIGTSPDDSCFDSVRPNYDSIVTQIVDYFVKHGYKSLGFMGETDFDIYSGKPLMDVREWSFRESAKYYGMLNEKNIFTTDTLTVKEGYRLALEAIKRLGNEMPSAFCVSSDTLAIGAFQAFHEAGWNIPSRVAFFSIGNLNISKYVSPPLTTFHIDIPLMCDAALSLLQERILKNRTNPKLDDEKRANLYNRANHFRRNNDYDKAMSIYEQILNEDQTDSEAYWSIVLCRYGVEYVEDPATQKRVPTINRTQFTSVFMDENFKSALSYADEEQKKVYMAEAEANDKIQQNILTISNSEEPFDVFICYKENDENGQRTPDSVLAADLYYGLTNEGFKVFFSRITLEDKLGTAYEPYIFSALNSAKVMIVLGTKAEYFNAVWVKNEWSSSPRGGKVLLELWRKSCLGTGAVRSNGAVPPVWEEGSQRKILF